MSELTHEEAAEELAGVALGSATPNVAERVRSHAQTCRECRTELAQFEATAGRLSDFIPEHPINPGRAAGIRSRLISRASADTERRPASVATTAASRVKPPVTQNAASAPATRVISTGEGSRGGIPSSVLAAVAGIALLGAGAAVLLMLRANAEADSLRATIELQRDTLNTDPKVAAPPALEQDKIVAAVTGSDVRIIPLTHYGARGPVGKMFWNRETNTWTLVTYSIRQPKPDRVFQVWLSTSTGAVAVGTFVPDATGRAIVQGSSPVSRDGLYSISVTEEAVGGAPAPTGPPVIAGAP